MSKATLCLVYEPGSNCVELAPHGGLHRRVATEYEVWTGDCVNPGTRVMSTPLRELANDVCIRLAMSMRLRAVPAGAP